MQRQPNANNIFARFNDRGQTNAASASRPALRSVDRVRSDAISRASRSYQTFRLRERRPRHNRESLDYFAADQLHRSGVVGIYAEEDRRNRVECPGNQLARQAVMLVLAGSDDDIERGCEREHIEKNARLPLPVGGIEKYKILRRFCIEALECSVNPLIAWVVQH